MSRSCSKLALGLSCLIFLHTPNGHHFAVRAEAIEVIKPVERSQHDHLAAHTNSVVFVGGKYHGIRETEEEVIDLRMKCLHMQSSKP